jgi:shikimate kinase / 3-dehydroquinate synthase
MGAGKSTAARELGGTDADDLVSSAAGKPIAEIFREEGEAAFRALEEQTIVLALGGGAVTSPAVRDALADTLTIWLDVDVDTCWERVKGSDRPLAQNEAAFRRLYEERRALYADVADVVAKDVHDVVLAAAGVHVERGALERLGELVPGEGAVGLVSDPQVAGIHGMDAQLALGSRLAETHELPPGEDAKTLAAIEQLWEKLRLDRDGTIVALGGGCTTDAAGFAAATYLRGIAWTPVPTSLVAQVDAAIGGKTASDLPQGKNLVGAFHYPDRVVIDPMELETLPEEEHRNGMAEVVKTGLLAGRPLWELPQEEMIRACAAFKSEVCLEDPHERKGRREILNLGHTFGHALEAASDYEVSHGEGVALGLKAVLALSGIEIDHPLDPQPVRVDRERAWAALERDKKVRRGRIRLVLLEALGKPVVREVEPDEARAALDELIVD